MGKRIVSILRPILMSLLIAAAVTFTVLGITTAIIFDTATVKAESEEHSHEGYTAWIETDSLPSTAGDYYLTADVTLSASWTVPAGTTNLCLNGHGIRLTSGTTVIKVNSGTFTLCDCGDTTHYFTAPENDYGKATNISDLDSGGQSSFIGGYITGGTAQAFDTGGGVHVTSGATFIMKGGTIIGNGYQGQEHIRGGGVAVIGGTFKMQGGAIMYNIVNNEGGGVYLRDGANMQMTGGIVSHNYAVNGSGGVHVSAGVSFSMSGGEIAYNHVGTTAGEGGGMCAYQGSLTMTGGSIHHNSVGANGVGGGVLYKENGNLIVSGSASIINNTAGEKTQNIYIINKSIQIADALTAGAQFGVTMHSNATGTFTSGWATYMGNADHADYFTSDIAGDTVIKDHNGELMMLPENAVAVVENGTKSYYIDFNSALSAWGDGGTLTLLKDVSITSTINIEEVTKTLDLNGHGIKMTGTGRVFAVLNGATFNITDSNPQIEHKFTVSNGLATVNDDLQSGYQTFTGGYLTGGNAKGSTENGWGGCLVVSLGGKRATLNISGGTIIGNHCDMSGAAIRLGGDKNDCTVFNMTGGTIMYNTAGMGGAITCEPNVLVKISGGIIDNNFVGSNESNVYLENDQTITVDTAFAAAASIGVKLATGQGTFTSGWATYMGNADPEDYFMSDIAGDTVIKDDNGELMMLPENAVAVVENGTKSYYIDFNSALSAWGDGGTLKLLKDVTAQITTNGGNKTLDLNDHSITYTGGTVIIVSGGTLTICDNSENKTVHYYLPNQNGVATLSATKTDYYFEGGYITGGVATEGRGGGLRVLGTGSVVFGGGTIFANSAGWGGGVWTSESGSLTIEGTAAVIGNYSSGAYTSGGGIFMEGSSAVTMTGGSIRHNSSEWSGGGIRDCVPESSGARFTMTGGEITGNYAKNNQGNGFCFDMATTFNIGGTSRIFGNQGTNDIYFYNDRYLTVVAPFEEGALIGVTLQGGTGTFTSGWATYMGNADPADYFTSDNGSYEIRLSDGEAYTGPHIHNWVFTADKNVITATCASVNKGTCDMANQTLTITASSKTYDGTAVTAQLSLSDGWTTANGLEIPSIYYSDGVNAATTTAPVSVGTYTASVTVSEKTAVAEFTITKAVLTITAEAKEKIYGENDPSFTYIQSGLVGSDTITGELSRENGEIVGTYAILQGTLSASDNYNISYVGANLVINKKTLTITAEAKEKIYGENDPSFTYIQSGLVGSDTITGELSRESGENVGTYAILQGTLSAGDNYNISYVGANLVINQKTLTITAEAKEKVYGENDPSFTYTQSGLVGSDTITGEFSRESGENIGTYAITQGTLTAGDNYNISYVGANLVINKKTLTITAEAKEKIYGENDPSFTYIQSGLVGSDTITGELSRESGENVGTYAILQGTLSSGNNYNISYVGANLVIKQKVETFEPESSDVKIDGLDEEIQEIVSENPTANSISLVVTVETKTDETAVNADSIIETAKNKSLEFFEIKVEKTIDSVTTVLDATNNVLEIAISYEKAAKKGITVYSYHGDNIITFVESDSKENGTFRVDKENKLVYVYANKFSTYAIGYTPDYRVHTSLSLGSYEGKASVTIKNDADENISFTLESADVKNIVFPDVPKGQYTMTIIWEAGKTNTLTMTLTVGPKAALSAITEQDAESETSEEQVEEQVEEQETQVDSPDIGTTDESEILTEDAKIETVAAEDSYVAYKAQAINREVGLVPRKREYMIKREFIFYL